MHQINPLNILGIRKVTFMPKHFVKVEVDSLNTRRIIKGYVESWIKQRLEGRYAIIETTTVENNTRTDKTVFGFEVPSEASYFALYGINNIVDDVINQT